LIEPEANCVVARDDRAVREGESHHQRGYASADSTETPGGLGDCDGGVVEGYPRARIDLYASLIRVPQSMDLKPERSHGLSLSILKGDDPAHRRAVCAQNFDW